MVLQPQMHYLLGVYVICVLAGGGWGSLPPKLYPPLRVGIAGVRRVEPLQ